MNTDDIISDDKVTPIYAYTYFSVQEDGTINQLLQFDYYDPDEFYANLCEEENHESYVKEIEKLWQNMDSFLEEEENYINGSKVYPKVVHVDKQRPLLDFSGNKYVLDSVFQKSNTKIYILVHKSFL